MAGQIFDIQFPEVNPTGAPGGDEERIRSTPEMFGGATAHAFGTLGEGITRTADAGLNYLVETNRMQDQTYASELHSNFSDQGYGIVSDFKELQGRAVLMQRDGVKQRLRDLQQQAEGQAPNLFTKTLVSENT